MATRGGQGQSPFMAAVLGPDLLERQYRMASQQALAQQLSQRGSEPLQGQMVSGHYVAPSWTQQLGRLLDTGMSAKLQSDMPENMANLRRDEQSQVASAFGLGGGSQSDPQALALALGAKSGPPGPTNQNAQRLGAALSGQPMMPLLPGRSREDSMRAFQSLGDQEYMKQVAQQGSPTDIQKNLIAQGIQPGSPQWNQALGATTEKAGYIAPVSASPGATLLDPRTNQPVFSAPQNGIQTQYGPNGQATASQVPGFAGAQAGIAGAEAAATEAARAGMDLVDVPDGQGGTIKMPRSQAVAVLGGSDGQQPSSQGSFGRSPNPLIQKSAERLNDNWVTNSYQPTIDSANSARDLSGTIAAMRAIPLETGFGAEAKGAAANLLTSLGVKNAATVATNTQKFQSLAMDRLQTELMKQKGPQTEGDAQRAGKTFAKISNTPEANKFIFDFAEAKANMDMRKAEFYEAALPLAQKQGDLTEIDRRWRKLQGSIWDDPLMAQYEEQ